MKVLYTLVAASLVIPSSFAAAADQKCTGSVEVTNSDFNDFAMNNVGRFLHSF